jgi:hypothetical protein
MGAEQPFGISGNADARADMDDMFVGKHGQRDFAVYPLNNGQGPGRRPPCDSIRTTNSSPPTRATIAFLGRRRADTGTGC